jgi:hypothetical protein
MPKREPSEREMARAMARTWIESVGVADATFIKVHKQGGFTAYFVDHVAAMKAWNKIQRAGGARVRHLEDRVNIRKVRFALIKEIRSPRPYYRYETDLVTSKPFFFVYQLGEQVGKFETEAQAKREVGYIRKEAEHASKLVRRNALLRERRTLEAIIRGIDQEIELAER